MRILVLIATSALASLGSTIPLSFAPKESAYRFTQAEARKRAIASLPDSFKKPCADWNAAKTKRIDLETLDVGSFNWAVINPDKAWQRGGTIVIREKETSGWHVVRIDQATGIEFRHAYYDKRGSLTGEIWSFRRGTTIYTATIFYSKGMAAVDPAPQLTANQ